jgi:hypothetical protein
MQSLDLTPAQAEALFSIVERQRVFVERLYARCVELGYPMDDHLRQHAAFAVVAQRKLCLAVNEGRPKGVYRQYLRRSKAGRTGLRPHLLGLGGAAAMPCRASSSFTI